MTDPTIEPPLTSWVEVARESDFPLQNLPYGVFRPAPGQPRASASRSATMYSISRRFTRREFFAPRQLLARISLRAMS